MYCIFLFLCFIHVPMWGLRHLTTTTSNHTKTCVNSFQNGKMKTNMYLLVNQATFCTITLSKKTKWKKRIKILCCWNCGFWFITNQKRVAVYSIQHQKFFIWKRSLTFFPHHTSFWPIHESQTWCLFFTMTFIQQCRIDLDSKSKFICFIVSDLQKISATLFFHLMHVKDQCPFKGSTAFSRLLQSDSSLKAFFVPPFALSVFHFKSSLFVLFSTFFFCEMCIAIVWDVDDR